MGSVVKKAASFINPATMVASAGKKILGGGGDVKGAIGVGRYRTQAFRPNRSDFNITGASDTRKDIKEEVKKASEARKETAGRRSELMDQLSAQARGEGPSLAEAQMRAAQDRTLAQQLAAAQQTTRAGGRQSAVARELARAQTAAGRDIAQQAGQARIQEMLQARQMLAQETATDQTLYNELVSNYLSQGFNIAAAEQQAREDYNALQAGAVQTAQQANLQGYVASQQQRGQMFSNVLGGVAQAIGMSDENSKMKKKKAKSSDISKKLKSVKKPSEDQDKTTGKKIAASIAESFSPQKSSDSNKNYGGVKKAISALGPVLAAKSDKNSKKEVKAEDIKKDFLDKLKAYTYEYKKEFKDHPKAGKGRHLSVMAQDLEKAGSIGKSMVSTDPKSGAKMVDYGKGFGAILAAQAHLNERLNKLEKRKKAKKGSKNGNRK